MPKLALIADIKSSRRVKERAELQRKMEHCLQRLTQTNPGIISPYTITLGDEFQALFCRADQVLLDVFRIMYELYPVSIRFSLGIGDITTDINPDQALGMDGPAFYRAREGMTYLKQSEDLLRLEGLPDSLNSLCNHSLQLLSHISAKWRRSRFQILLGLSEGMSVKDLAEQLQISEQAVYKNISDGSLESVLGLLDDISLQINQTL
ncbi:helix-turn-helix domain-containing protein [Hahella ganghwensis]|uniref:helix-turn-helix domain-containing protein n=1 Tax=Hahella ganghwensis TaxID=286420 RepID=UPI00036949CC|nr:helix-turn-helix domain-containing protein [Hahella ganghwensis]